jgi:DNA mismatch repair protein MutL
VLLETQTRIRQLPADVVNKIAAGEVVERPASVVKELLENSVDALATRIVVDLQQGGIELIRVSDDGEGMDRDDLPLAVASHATSKIETAEDLFRVRTLGFRGEALASIAGVSRFAVRSRRHDSDCGYELSCDGGRPSEVRPCGCPPGTSIEVRQLFAHTPVRRKFLRAEATEFGHAAEQFTRIALAHARLQLALTHNGRIVHELPAEEQITGRLQRFFGKELLGHLIPIDSEADGIRLWGYVADPSQSKSTRKGQHLFLNGRWIQDRSLQHALGEAYRGLLMTGRYPIAFLFLELPPDQVDVNVHPTKSEVRFRDGQRLYRQLLSSLRNTFLSRDFKASVHLPSQPVQKPPVSSERQQELRLDFVRWAKDQLAAALAPPSNPDAASVRVAEHDPLARSAEFSRVEPAPLSNPASLRAITEGQRSEVGDQRSEVGGNHHSPLTTHHSPPPRVMQVHDCYLVVESDEGLTVVDQHALHERILYEQLRTRVLDGAVESQRLLVPDPVEFTAEEAAVLIDHTELLAQLGFQVEEFGGNTLLLSAYPVMLARADRAELLRDVAGRLVSDSSQPDRRDLLDGLLHMMSCKAAIKAGQRLAPEEMESLLSQRHLVENSHHCPHGRPTALVLSRHELDRQFGRLG